MSTSSDKSSRKKTSKKATKKRTKKSGTASKKKTARKTLKKTKQKAKRKTARKVKPGSNRWTLFGKLSKFALILLIAVAIPVVIYGLILDAQIKDRFVGQPWQQPARVYARAVDLYAGMSLSANELERHVIELGYKRVKQPSRKGEYGRSGDQLRLISRGHALSGVPSRALDIYFSGRTVVDVNDAKGDRLPLASLEPQMIGSILARSGEDRMVIGADDVPDLLKQALVAVEDRRFESHQGLDLRGIARAALANLRAGRVEQGGSTITQQLIKSHFLSNEKTWRRKFKEALMAISIDARMDKQEIMLAYINEIYMGQDGGRAIHGFDLASRFYFSRRLDELEIHQIATLTGMVRGPSQYNPRRHPAAALERRNQVLGILRDQEVISAESAEDALTQPLGITDDRTGNFGGYPTVLSMVKQQLLRDYEQKDLISNGLSVFTTLDVIAQQRVEKNMSLAVGQLEQNGSEEARGLQTAAAVLAPDTGELIALVGGRQIGFDGFNRALDMRRPIGSLIKPFVYLTALESGRYDLDTVVSSAPLEVELETGQIWSPRNFNDEYGGDVPVFKALAQSINTPAVRAGMDIGVDKVVSTLYQHGLAREVDAFPSLLLGAVELSPLEVAQLYVGLAGSGFVTPPRVVSTVKNNAGTELNRYPLEVKQAASADSAYQIMRTLGLTATHGTARSLTYRLPGANVAGKTGSTNDLRDSWFAGISQSAVAVVWVGRDDNAPTGLTGSQGALPVWAGIMRALDAGSISLYAPESMSQSPFDFETGDALGYCDPAVLIPLRTNFERPLLTECR
ncbi:MAG: penicillin-binding protein 1B [Gammaproteobacteria bacterium]